MSDYPSDLRFPHDQLLKIAADLPDKCFLRQPRNGQWHSYSYSAVEKQVRQVASFLIEQGLKQGERVLIFGKNSMEWVVADWAINLAGGVSVPIFSAADRDTVNYITDHCKAKGAFVGKLDNIQAYQGLFTDLSFSVAFPYDCINTGFQWQDIIEKPLTDTEFPQRKMEEMMTIVYTSGSTGKPKGVVHTFETFSKVGWSYAKTIHDTQGLSEERGLSYLPLAHITERVVGQAIWLYCYEVGATFEVSFTESLATFADNLRDTKPTVFVSVPRLWQKFQSAILAKMPQSRLNILLCIPILSGIVKNKIKKQMGFDQAHLFATGSAPIAPSLLHWYEQIGINIGQGWGMTETGASGTAQLPYRSEKRETIGKPCYGMDVRIGEADEIQVKSDFLFTEYYLQPDVTADAFTEDGYFKTGDQGAMDSEGYIKIVGRLKDIFKTDKGKYVAPAPIESKLAKSNLIDQCCIIGNNLPQPLVLVVLDESSTGMSKAEIERNLSGLLDEVNKEVEKHERMSSMLILPEPWTVESGLITPTLKIKRQVIEKHFHDLCQQAYSNKIEWID